MFAWFADNVKVFVKFKHVDLFNKLKALDLDVKNLHLMRKLYWNQKAAARATNKENMRQEIKCGVRQSCVLSPDLFNLYNEVIMRDLEDLVG